MNPDRSETVKLSVAALPMGAMNALSVSAEPEERSEIS